MTPGQSPQATFLSSNGNGPSVLPGCLPFPKVQETNSRGASQPRGLVSLDPLLPRVPHYPLPFKRKAPLSFHLVKIHHLDISL